MSSVESRIHKLESRVNTTYGMVAGAIVVLLAFLGFTSWNQIPKEIQSQLPGVVEEHIRDQNSEILLSIEAAKNSIDQDSEKIKAGVAKTTDNVAQSSDILGKLTSGEIPFRVETGGLALTWKENAELKDPKTSGRRGIIEGEAMFEKEFQKPPSVQIGISGLDLSKETNVRVFANIIPGSITTQGFKYELGTFSDSVVYGLGATWMAAGF